MLAIQQEIKIITIGSVCLFTLLEGLKKRKLENYINKRFFPDLDDGNK